MAFIASARTLGPTLVLRRFHVNATPQDNVYAEIVGRPEGLLGWLLTAMGLDAQVTYRITDADVTCESAGLQGKSREIAPISNIASASVGYMKSIWTLILGLLAVAVGLYKGVFAHSMIALVLGLVIGGVFLAVYWFSSRLHVAVITNGGSILGLRFKRSVIENVSVDFEKCAAVVDVLQQLMLAAQSRREINSPSTASPRQAASGATTASMRPAAPVPPTLAPRSAPAATARRCPKCGSPAEPHVKFCEDCGTRVDAQ